jgi:hypothetical protein
LSFFAENEVLPIAVTDKITQYRSFSQSFNALFFDTLEYIAFKDERMCWHYNKVKNIIAIGLKPLCFINWSNDIPLTFQQT